MWCLRYTDFSLIETFLESTVLLIIYQKHKMTSFFVKTKKHKRDKRKTIYSNNFPLQSLLLHDCSRIRTHKDLVRKRTVNHLAKLASLAKWLSAPLQTKWLWVRLLLQSLKLQISRLFRARSSLTFR